MTSSDKLIEAKLPKAATRSPVMNPRALVSKLVPALEPQEAEVIRLRVGLDCPVHSCAEAGRVIGLSASRVWQIEEKAFRKLRWICNTIDIADDAAIARFIESRITGRREKQLVIQSRLEREARAKEDKRRLKERRDEARRAKARHNATGREIRRAETDVERLKDEAGAIAQRIARLVRCSPRLNRGISRTEVF